MSLDKQINQYLPLLANEEKKSILFQIKSFLKIKEDQPELTKAEFIIQYNKELEEAEARMDAGHFTSLEDAIKQSESW